MRIEEKGRLKIELYDDIAEMPIVRFQRFNKMMLIDSGIGSDMRDVDTHIQKVMGFVTKGESDAARQELENMRQLIYFIIENVSPKQLAFAALVKSINGVPCDDLSDAGLQSVRERIQNEPNSWLNRMLESAKKKIDQDLELYFPELFEEVSIKEYYDMLRRRTLHELDAIIKGENQPKEVEEIDTMLLTFIKPQSFSGSEGMEVKYDKQFEDICLILTKETRQNAREMSVLAFYNALQTVRQQQKQTKGRGNRQK